MKKRFILLISLLLFALSLTSCTSETTITPPPPKENTNNYFVFQSKKSDDYIQFLETFDNSMYEIVDISVGFSKFDYTYAITYKKNANHETSKIREASATYQLYQTNKIKEYLAFLETFDETKYDIVDISVSHSEFYYFYSITYKEII